MIEAFNSAVVTVGQGLSLAGDFVSSIIDFRDSGHGSIQMRWTGAVGVLGSIVIHGSNWRDPTTFDDNDVEQSSYVIAKANGSHLWSYHKLTFRYAQLRYTANGTTAGLVDIVARGNK